MVHDNFTTGSTAVGNTPPAGTVTFTLFRSNNCTGTIEAGPEGPVNVVNGQANSTPVTLNPATTQNYSYRAHYNGDGNFQAADATCEPFTVTAGGKHLIVGPASMEGALKFPTGSWVSAGWHLKLSKKNPAPVTVNVSGNVLVPVHCGSANGPIPAGSPITVPVSYGPITIPANSQDWFLTGDQNNILSFMGAVQAPNLCAGGLMYNSSGATFDGFVSGTQTVGVITFQFHYRIPAAKGQPNTNCTDANDPNRNSATICGASWSPTKDP
jgi:hypothetical protein